MFDASDKKAENMSLIIFIALEDGTKLRILPNNTINIPVGKMYITSQDFWHAGAGYDHSNLRLLFKVNYNGGSDKVFKKNGCVGSIVQTEQYFVPFDVKDPGEWIKSETKMRDQKLMTIGK